MITEQFLTHLTATQRSTLELLLARDEGCEVSRGELAELPELLDLEHVGLLGWNAQGGEYLTAKGRALVVNLAHTDATREDLQRLVLAATPSGRHRAQEFVDSMAEALDEHTADLVDLAAAVNAAQQSWTHRFGRWFARNLTGTRVTVMAGTAGVLVGTGIGWWVR